MPRGATSLVLRPVGETWSRYGDICCPTVPFVTWNATDGRWNAFHSTARFYASFHLIEQPIDGFWSARMASTSSRDAPSRGGVMRPSSSRPRYLSLRSAL